MSVHEVQWLCSRAECNIELYSEHNQLQLQNAARSGEYRNTDPPQMSLALLLGLCTALQGLTFKRDGWQ